MAYSVSYSDASKKRLILKKLANRTILLHAFKSCLDSYMFFLQLKAHARWPLLKRAIMLITFGFKI